MKIFNKIIRILKKVLFFYLILYLILSPVWLKEKYDDFKFVVSGFEYKKKLKKEVWQSDVNFYRFYYTEDMDYKYEKKGFSKVLDDGEYLVELTKEAEWVAEFKEELSYLKSIISEDDYYYLKYEKKDKFNLYLYDIEERVLYFLRVRN